MVPTKDVIASYADASAVALALQIEPAWRDGVVEQLTILFANADLVAAFELPDDEEPAPVYEVVRDGK